MKFVAIKHKVLVCWNILDGYSISDTHDGKTITEDDWILPKTTASKNAKLLVQDILLQWK